MLHEGVYKKGDGIEDTTEDETAAVIEHEGVLTLEGGC